MHDNCGKNASVTEITPNERLKDARVRAGYRSARDAALQLGFNVNTYGGHETGTRGITLTTAQKYALAFGVSASWILTGETDARGAIGPDRLPVVGYVGAGELVFSIDDHEKGGGLDYVDAPPGCKPGSVAILVRGDSMSPAYLDGDCLIYSERTEAVDELVGGERVVWLEDGRVLVKRLLPGTRPGHYTLISHNAEPIGDARVIYAAKIEWVKKA